MDFIWCSTWIWCFMSIARRIQGFKYLYYQKFTHAEILNIWIFLYTLKVWRPEYVIEQRSFDQRVQICFSVRRYFSWHLHFLGQWRMARGRNMDPCCTCSNLQYRTNRLPFFLPPWTPFTVLQFHAHAGDESVNRSLIALDYSGQQKWQLRTRKSKPDPLMTLWQMLQ